MASGSSSTRRTSLTGSTHRVPRLDVAEPISAHFTWRITAQRYVVCRAGSATSRCCSASRRVSCDVNPSEILCQALQSAHVQQGSISRIRTAEQTGSGGPPSDELRSPNGLAMQLEARHVRVRANGLLAMATVLSYTLCGDTTPRHAAQSREGLKTYRRGPCVNTIQRLCGLSVA